MPTITASQEELIRRLTEVEKRIGRPANLMGRGGTQWDEEAQTAAVELGIQLPNPKFYTGAFKTILALREAQAQFRETTSMTTTVAVAEVPAETGSKETTVTFERKTNPDERIKAVEQAAREVQEKSREALQAAEKRISQLEQELAVARQLAAGCVSPPIETKELVDDLQAKIKSLETENAGLGKTVNNLLEKTRKLEADLQKAPSPNTLDNLTGTIHELNRLCAERQNTIHELHQKLDEVTARAPQPAVDLVGVTAAIQLTVEATKGTTDPAILLVRREFERFLKSQEKSAG